MDLALLMGMCRYLSPAVLTFRISAKTLRGLKPPINSPDTFNFSEYLLLIEYLYALMAISYHRTSLGLGVRHTNIEVNFDTHLNYGNIASFIFKIEKIEHTF